MDYLEKKMLEVINRNHDCKVLADKLNAISARRKRTETAAWLNRTFLAMVILVEILLLILLLWQLKVIPDGPSSLVSKVITCAVSFLAGRTWEVLKR